MKWEEGEQARDKIWVLGEVRVADLERVALGVAPAGELRLRVEGNFPVFVAAALCEGQETGGG
jgi:hypothetical protein